ncbi:MAG: YciI family protein [Pirellulales bacterium]|nr:YciI family protein [Pirellulales bacterium]
MKFICLGYIEDGKWERMSQREQNALMEECFAYDDVLRKNGHFAGGEALQGPRSAATLRWQGGRVAVTDGPYAETKEQLGGILILEAKDSQHAIELMSKHPGVRLGGPFEIRPAAEEINELVSRRDRAAKM